MRRNPTLLLVAAGGLTLGLGSVGLAGDQDHSTPYQTSHQLQLDSPNHTRLVYPDRRHPEVEVSRSLSAQPVHPWKAKVVLNNTMSTYIDPARDLSTSSGLHLDDNHSLVKAQRRHNQLSGVTTTERNRQRNQRKMSRIAVSQGNRASVVRPNRPSRDHADRGRSARPNSARVVRPNRGRPQPQRTRVHPTPQRNTPAPASEPAPKQKQQRDRRAVPMPSVPRHKEQPSGKIASTERP
jgi:hypothetical protein